MNAHHDRRQHRKTQPTLENLDSRIAPTAASAAALAAELRVESRHVSRWEALLATSRPGSREQTLLTKHIARTEGRMVVQEARLARIKTSRTIAAVSALPAAQNPPALMPQNSVAPRVTPAASPIQPVRPGHPIIVTAPVEFGLNQFSSQTGSTSTASGTLKSPAVATLPANVAQTLDVIYAAYEADPSDFPVGIPATNGANLVQLQGTDVGIDVHVGNAADFNSLVTALENAGMQITVTSAEYGIVDGFLPVAQLPAIAALTDAPSVTPLYQPMTH
jgi:hypothetical protein